MMLRFLCFMIFLTAFTESATAQKEPVLVAHGALVYPPIARAARISGEVKIEFSINDKGEASSLAVLDGPKLLREAAISFVKGWRFHLEDGGWNPETKYNTNITFKVAEAAVDPRSTNDVTIRADSFKHFEVSIVVSDIQLSNCPTGADEEVPGQTEKDDFVVISRSACYGSCPAYSVKVEADGTVTWSGQSSVAIVGERKSSVDVLDARDLLEKFRTMEFWSYCGDYSRSITDMSGSSVTVRLGGKTRTINDYAESGPKALQELLLDVDRTVDSHYWRHGEPTREPITRIDSDCYLPKPGVTPLMISAGWNDTDRLKLLINAGADVKRVDSSGWTALMYASSASSAFPVQVLLKAGADPNQSSPRGDTPLMVSALSGIWNDVLARAGARLNARNKDGQTALMILAERGDPDSIGEALKAGADATLRDAKGRTALDYLRLASCGNVRPSIPSNNGCRLDIPNVPQLIRTTCRSRKNCSKLLPR